MIDYKQATVFSWFSGALDRGHRNSFAPCVLYIREIFYQGLTIPRAPRYLTIANDFCKT